jgi:hypothetical protein
MDTEAIADIQATPAATEEILAEMGAAETEAGAAAVVADAVEEAAEEVSSFFILVYPVTGEQALNLRFPYPDTRTYPTFRKKNAEEMGVPARFPETPQFKVRANSPTPNYLSVNRCPSFSFFVFR